MAERFCSTKSLTAGRAFVAPRDLARTSLPEPLLPATAALQPRKASGDDEEEKLGKAEDEQPSGLRDDYRLSFDLASMTFGNAMADLREIEMETEQQRHSQSIPGGRDDGESNDGMKRTRISTTKQMLQQLKELKE
jgi:hypothetical protein